jgi:hypothetical protein
MPPHLRWQRQFAISYQNFGYAIQKCGFHNAMLEDQTRRHAGPPNRQGYQDTGAMAATANRLFDSRQHGVSVPAVNRREAKSPSPGRYRRSPSCRRRQMPGRHGGDSGDNFSFCF